MKNLSSQSLSLKYLLPRGERQTDNNYYSSCYAKGIKKGQLLELEGEKGSVRNALPVPPAIRSRTHPVLSYMLLIMVKSHMNYLIPTAALCWGFSSCSSLTDEKMDDYWGEDALSRSQGQDSAWGLSDIQVSVLGHHTPAHLPFAGSQEQPTSWRMHIQWSGSQERYFG